MKRNCWFSMKRVSVNVDLVKVYAILSKNGVIINACVRVKN